MTAVQSTTRRRILRLFVRRALRAADAAKDRSAWQHDGDFSLDAGVRSEGHDRPGMERLLRYCARPPFARERIERSEQERILYHLPKPTPEGQIRLRRSPLELIGCLAALTPAAPPPRLWRARTQRQAAPGRDRDGLRGQGDRRGWHPCQRRGRQRDRQSLTGTVSLGDAAGPTLRGVSAALPRVRGTAADHRVHHRYAGDAPDPGPHRRAFHTATARPGAAQSCSAWVPARTIPGSGVRCFIAAHPPGGDSEETTQEDSTWGFPPVDPQPDYDHDQSVSW
jgi:hypothetical protein